MTSSNDDSAELQIPALPLLDGNVFSKDSISMLNLRELNAQIQGNVIILRQLYIQSNQFSNGETKQSRIRAHCWRRSLHFECARVSLLRICSLELSCILADIRPVEASYWFLVEWFTVCSETKQTDCRHKALMQMAARMQHLLHTQSNWSTLKATELTESLVCVTPAQWFCASDLDLRRKKKASARHHSEDQHPRKFCLNTAWN